MISSILLGAAFLFSSPVFATTYCVRADGSSTKAGAVGPDTDATKCMSLSTHNSSTFSAGDIIQLSDKGGAFTATNLVPPSSGSAGNVITYMPVPGEAPSISPNAQNAVSISQKSYLTLQGLTVGSQSALSYAAGVSFSGSNLTFSSTTITMPSLGYLMVSQGTSTNVTVTGLTGSGAGSYSLYFYGANSSGITVSSSTISGGKAIYIANYSGITLQNILHSNAATPDGDLNISNGSGVLTISNYTSTSSLTYGIFIGSSAFSAGSTIANSTINTPTSIGVYLRDTSGITVQGTTVRNGGNAAFQTSGSSSNITFTSNTADRANLYGFYSDGTSNHITLTGNTSKNSVTQSGFFLNGTSNVSSITYSNNTSDNNAGDGYTAQGTTTAVTHTGDMASNNRTDGFSTMTTAHDVTYTDCLAFNNGTKSSTSSGDGFTAHSTNYNINIYNSAAYYNTASGYAMVGNSSGRIYHSVAYGNAGNWAGQGGVDQVRGGFYFSLDGNNPTSGTTWDVKDSISASNYPREIYVSVLAPTMDYNLYHPLSDAAFATLDGGTTTLSWASYSSREPHSRNGDPLFANAIQNSAADFSLTALSAAIDIGGTSGLSTDYLGNAYYGSEDAGMYEYLPTYTIGTNLPNSGGSLRVYGDGKYRYTVATSTGSSADFGVAPVGGFPSYGASAAKPAWLDISLMSWNVSGDRSKSWTASSSIATTTIFTIGDLLPWTMYTVSVDGLSSADVEADVSGRVTYPYSGGYSAHAFSVALAPAPVLPSSVSSGSRGIAVSVIPPASLLPTKPTPAVAASSSMSFDHDLQIGDVGEDVARLQKYLNAHGYVVSRTGAGSPGKETRTFGPATRAAVMRFQKAHALPVTGFFGPLSRGAALR